jgi:hypothetical protein
MNKLRLATAGAMMMASLVLASPAMAATLSLSPASGLVNKGCAFGVSVQLNTGGVDVDGTDVILKYNPKQFTVSSVVNGSIFNDYPGNSIDNAAGKVSIYALASQNTSFTGSGIVATVNFTPATDLAATSPTISFDFDSASPTKTTDSNVTQKGTTSDILSSVTNGTYTLGTTSCAGGVAQGQVATPSATLEPEVTTTSTPTTLPNSGRFENTLMVLGLGVLLAIIGGLGVFRERFR